MHNFFRTKYLLKHRNDQWCFSFLWSNIFKGEKFYPISYAYNFSIAKVFRNIKWFPHEFVSNVRQKTSREKSEIPFLCIKFFDTRNFLKYLKVPKRKMFGTETKKLRQSQDAPPLLCMKTFDTRLCLKQRRYLLQSFLVLRDKRFPTKTRDVRFLCIKFVGTRSILKTGGLP